VCLPLVREAQMLNKSQKSTKKNCHKNCKNLACKKSGAVIGEVFSGSNGASATVYLQSTPKQGAVKATVQVNKQLSMDVERIHQKVRGLSYEEKPVAFEVALSNCFTSEAAPLATAISYAFDKSAVIIEVLGLPGPESQPSTPLNGIIDESCIGEHVINLVGTFASTMGFQGFAYSGENGGHLLRAVAPKSENAGQASSQGFKDDLGMHMDNANRTIPHTFDVVQYDRGPMNAYQAFATITPCSNTPMEVASLQDMINETIEAFGGATVTQLEQPDYAVCKPDSHGGGPDISGVPVIARDGEGRAHGRFHMGNVKGITPEAEEALEKFRSIIAKTASVVKIRGRKNALILYSNSQCMHRRSKYTPRLDGTDRYYVRLYLSPSDVMAAFSDHAVGRVFK
jgi:hypothetical protein